MPQFFRSGDPYTKNWYATVNGTNAVVYSANGGGSHAVQIPAGGQSKIEFRYWSWPAFWGIVLSCITLTIAGFLASFQKNRNFKLFICLISIIIACGLGILWYTSLYNGENLNTNYYWHSGSDLENQNIAYRSMKLNLPKIIYAA